MKDKIKMEKHLIDESQNASRLVDELERLKKERKQVEEKYRNMFEYAIDAIITSNNKGFITSCNKKAEEMFGYNREEMIGKSVSILIPRKKRNEEKKILKSIALNIKSGVIGSIKEGIGLTKDGQTFPIEASYYAFRANDEYILTGIFRDISERKQIEEHLRESEERARALINATTDIALLVDKKGTIIDFNEALIVRLNKSRDELVGKTPFDLFDREVAKGRNKFLKQVFSEGIPVRFQDGHRGRWFDHSIHPILDKQGKVKQVAIFAHDITKLKQREEEIIAARDKLKALALQTTEIEEQARRTGALYLHDRVGQTLFVLKIRLEMIAKTKGNSETSEDWKDIFKLIEKLIDDARILSYEMSPAILNELGLEAALESLVDQTNRQHDIVVSFRSDQQPKPLEDDICTLLYRAVSELLTNIVKHANAKNVIISIRKDNNQVQLDIEDDGAGFETERLKFLPDKNKGFGLFSIKERLQWHHGDMVIKSTRGQGTQINLLAPLKK